MNEQMMETFLNRRSVRSYTGEAVPMEKLNTIIMAGLSSASSRAIRPWDLIVVRDKDKLIEMSGCRLKGSSRMLAGADAAIVVVGDEERSDVWIEDCSVVMANMHLMASALGVGSCWIQGRDREAVDGETTEDFLRRILQFPSESRLLAILSLGMPDEELPARTPESLPFNKVHINKY
ncbi:MAG: nitroreductase family protein [Lachnospiraceae bacterium]|jgi:nitroreductase|nr:nitroreductase family protein [Lachnospiraceae bacterium]